MQENEPTKFTSKFLLTDEEILRRGVPENLVASYRAFQYNEAYSISQWIGNDELRKHTFDTCVLPVSLEESKHLLIYFRYIQHSQMSKRTTSEWIEDYKKTQESVDKYVSQVKSKIDTCLQTKQKVWKDGFFAKFNSRSPKDVFICEGQNPRLKQMYWEKLDDYLFSQLQQTTPKNDYVDSNEDKEEKKYHTDSKVWLFKNLEEVIKEIIQGQRHLISSTNAVLAYFHLITEEMCLHSSNDLINMFAKSFRCLEDLQKSVSLGAYMPDAENVISIVECLSQYYSSLYFPQLCRDKEQIGKEILEFFQTHIESQLRAGHESYVIDFLRLETGPNAIKIYVIELNPFYAQTGAALFNWKQHRELFMNGPFEFRVRTEPNEKCDEYLHQSWKISLDEYRNSEKTAKPQSTDNTNNNFCQKCNIL
ncbi:hypothetical protein RFI_02506 [Reticulomyxa filosa]|uniref:Cell division cycle protein 123 n=1 Tax=Reticulomyxa filosa TaxID=46433 RepID=X6P8Z3_RETFI|nr:hypothetical protein RFI_02506 [Reticulomyxa filosa]|eukprot:ETO34583.1 hypothetical protein RFI_02506 [Reticulomyxa filosa]